VREREQEPRRRGKRKTNTEWKKRRGEILRRTERDRGKTEKERKRESGREGGRDGGREGGREGRRKRPCGIEP
jgi:hypothetical protein